VGVIFFGVGDWEVTGQVSMIHGLSTDNYPVPDQVGDLDHDPPLMTSPSHSPINLSMIY
jgi:hypothetical protein